MDYDKDIERQVVAFLISNGHSYDSVMEIPTSIFNDICTSYQHGLIGNKAIVRLLVQHTNIYISSKTKEPPPVSDLLGPSYKYFYYEPSKEEQEQTNLNAWWAFTEGLLAQQNSDK